MIDLQGLTVGYANDPVLKGLTLRADSHAIGLLGPNGAGKSTLIKALLGHLPLRSGSGTVLGLDVRRDFLDIRQRVGYMPERDCLFPGMNGVGSTTFAGELVGMQHGDAKQRAHEVLDYVGLAEERYRPVESYSAGMLQRVKLAQALVHDPKLVFLDEPTNGMDPKGRIEMLELVGDIARDKGIHVLVSSHLLPDVEAVCTDVIVLAGGEVLAQGNIEEMREGAGSGYVVRVKGDRDAFREALDKAGCPVDDGPRETLRVTIDDGGDIRTVWEVARATNVQIRHLEPARRSLEDVFMDAIEHGGEPTAAGVS